MALTFLGYKVNIKPDLIPPTSGFPTFTEFEPMYSRKITLSVSRDAVAVPNKSLTFLKIFSHPTVGLTAQVGTILSDQFEVTNNDLEYFYDLVGLGNNMGENAESDMFLPTGVEFICEVIIRIRVI